MGEPISMTLCDCRLLEALRALVCEARCAYFKPGKEEAERCGGFEQLRRWAQSFCDDLRWQGALGQPGPSGTPLAQDALLERAVCSSCAFREGDCDYRDPDGPRPCPPCGGLVALDLLLRQGVLLPDDLSSA